MAGAPKEGEREKGRKPEHVGKKERGRRRSREGGRSGGGREKNNSFGVCGARFRG